MLDWRPYWSSRTLPAVTVFQHCSSTTWAKPSISTFSILNKLLQPNLLTESFIGNIVKVTYCFSAFQLIHVAVMTKFLCVDPPLNAAINPFTRKVPASTPQKQQLQILQAYPSQLQTASCQQGNHGSPQTGFARSHATTSLLQCSASQLSIALLYCANSQRTATLLSYIASVKYKELLEYDNKLQKKEVL